MTSFDTPASGVGRFGALTYTSYSAPSNPGAPGRSGWQVKEQSADIDDVETALLTGWVTRTFDPVEPIPQYPTAADIAALPRSLTYVRLDAARAVHSHTAPAGSDNQGRPGNVFAHLLLDRAVHRGAAHRRPIDLWRSPDWLTPFGQTDVAAATLDPATPCPHPTDAVGRRAVLDFLLGSQTRRITTLCLLLDAVAHCLRGGPRIVLAVDDPDTAALWIAALTAFTSPACAATISWSTFVRAGEVDAALARGLHLVAIPTRDTAALVDDNRRVVVDTSDTARSARRGEFGTAPHRTARGAEVEVTEWSELAETALVDHATADAVLGELDTITDDVRDRALLEPAWPLAMAVAANTDLREAHRHARQVIVRETRVRLSDHPALHQKVLAVMLPGIGDSAEDAWRVLTAPDVARFLDPSTRDLVWKIFVDRALDEPAWVAAERRSYAVSPPVLTEADTAGIAEKVRTAARRLAMRADTHRRNLAAVAEIARAALRTLELFEHLGPAGRGADDTMIDVLEQTLGPVLLDRPRGLEFVGDYGPIDDHVRAAFVQPAMASDRDFDQPLGQRFADQVADWLIGPAVPDLAALRRDPDLIASLPYHIGADRIFRNLTGPRSRSGWAQYAPIALMRALHEASAPHRFRPTDIAPLFEEHSNITDLVAIDRGYGGVVPIHLYHRALVSAATTEELDELARHILLRAGSDPDPDIALRATAPNPGLDALTESWAELARVNWHTVRRDDLDRWSAVFVDHYSRPDSRPPAALNFNLGIAYLLARSTEVERRTTVAAPLRPDHAAAVIDAVAENWNATVAILRRLVDHVCLDAAWICGLAVVTTFEPLASASLSTQDPLRSLYGDRGETLFEEVARNLLECPHRWGAPATTDRLADAVRRQLRANGNDRRFDKTDLREFAGEWRDRSTPRGVRV
ncbi:GAP1-N2 domain-containing protein [Nocardia bovistercoris]|uniref:Uncharacterized protein n=1 Tax=Nocardia bovistercoris TaxID=2785916 RepID=A0A931IFI6_9NOCA|nr:hypothetical protein [Nocardia bovistercoris]MBH0779608.1 hypothetical protein [Nocardia bovistercoris]